MSCRGCGRNGANVIPVFNQDESTASQKGVIILPGPGIGVENLSDADNYRFRISTQEFVALTVALTLVAKEAGVVKTSPILKGTIIDEIELNWTYNKAVNSQLLTNNSDLIEPSLEIEERAYEYSAQDIDSNISFTIAGNDGLGQPGSTASSTKSISFGNILYLGTGPDKFNTATSGIEAFIESLTAVTKTARSYSYHATGGTNQYHFIAYPKAWGLATFTKGIFTGGYVRLKNVLGTLKAELGGGDVESDITITNSKGYTEEYYVYQSLFDDQADAVTPFVIS